MAQVDTGLGWSCKSEYLISNPDEICSYSSIEFPDVADQPIPTSDNYSTPGVARSVGLLVAQGKINTLTTRLYVVAQSGIEALISCRDSQSTVTSYATVNSKPAGYVRWELYYGNTLQNSGTVYTSYQTNVPGIYYNNFSGNYTLAYTPADVSWYVPYYADGIAAGDAIQVITESYYKLNQGAAVGCCAKWYNLNGEEVISPILISNNADYATISTDQTTPATQGRVTVQWNGINFIMAYVTNASEEISAGFLPNIDLRQFGAATPEKVFKLIANESFANITVISAPDPYSQNTEESEEGGGDGDEIQDDEIDFTPPPTSMAIASGFITLFCPSQAELNALADYMWSPLFDVDTLKKLFANPMDCILGLSVIPVPIVPEGTKTVKVGGVSTTVSMGYTNHQYYPVDCGTVTIPKRWDAYMDYAPYTRLNIFLPYIGFRQISADDVMGKTLHLRYMIDILSGACNAELKVNNAVLYSWAGSCAMQIPITGNDWRSAITAGVSIAGSVAATVLSGGASAPMIAGTVASATVNSLALKPEVQRSGSLSSASGFLAAQRPYIVRTNPRNAIPANQNKYSGYPSFVTVGLGSLTGYNEVYSVHLENIPATGAELDEIETILKGGAIF